VQIVQIVVQTKQTVIVAFLSIFIP